MENRLRYLEESWEQYLLAGPEKTSELEVMLGYTASSAQVIEVVEESKESKEKAAKGMVARLRRERREREQKMRDHMTLEAERQR